MGADIHLWAGFEAAHIFPLAHEGHWKQHNFGRWISLQPITGGTINSVQNGLLLTWTVHQLFDIYAFSINPDVCIPQPYRFLKVIVADDYLRKITRSYASFPFRLILPARISIRGCLLILNDLSMSFYVGTSGRLS